VVVAEVADSAKEVAVVRVVTVLLFLESLQVVALEPSLF
jgi:hypothetical protein